MSSHITTNHIPETMEKDIKELYIKAVQKKDITGAMRLLAIKYYLLGCQHQVEHITDNVDDTDVCETVRELLIENYEEG